MWNEIELMIMSFLFSILISAAFPQISTSFLCYLRNINRNFSVTCFSETWLTPSNFNVYGIDGYNHVGLTRESGRGGIARTWNIILCSIKTSCAIGLFKTASRKLFLESKCDVVIL